jgi:serralysin
MILNSNKIFLGNTPITNILIDGKFTSQIDLGIFIEPIQPYVPDPVTTSYTSFGFPPPEVFYPSLYVYEGRNIAFLVENNFYNPQDYLKMQSIVDTFDSVYDWYEYYTGQKPILFRNYNNKLSIASVEVTCGAGCGYIGFTGIEIQRNWWNTAYVNNLITLNNGLYDQTLFYEFGRNFWFSDPQLWLPNLPFMDAAFAIFMRFITMERTNVQGAPFNGVTPFTTFKNTITGMMTTYLNGPYSWDNTFKLDRGVPNALGLNGASDLMASMFYELKNRFGNLWLENIWKITKTKPAANNIDDVVNNFITSCADAVNLNLYYLFDEYYRWPVSQFAKRYMEKYPAYIMPELSNYAYTNKEFFDL